MAASGVGGAGSIYVFMSRVQSTTLEQIGNRKQICVKIIKQNVLNIEHKWWIWERIKLIEANENVKRYNLQTNHLCNHVNVVFNMLVVFTQHRLVYSSFFLLLTDRTLAPHFFGLCSVLPAHLIFCRNRHHKRHIGMFRNPRTLWISSYSSSQSVVS